MTLMKTLKGELASYELVTSNPSCFPSRIFVVVVVLYAPHTHTRALTQQQKLPITTTHAHCICHVLHWMDASYRMLLIFKKNFIKIFKFFFELILFLKKNLFTILKQQKYFLKNYFFFGSLVVNVIY